MPAPTHEDHAHSRCGWGSAVEKAHGAGHVELLAALLGAGPVTSRLVPDAHLAALAVEHRLVLCSTDGDCARFAGLRWENPLAPRA